jgi:hypothetical protein
MVRLCNNTHFSIKVQSQLAPDVNSTFRFSHISHFNNWIEKVKTSANELHNDSKGSYLIPNTEEFYDLFKDGQIFFILGI